MLTPKARACLPKQPTSQLQRHPNHNSDFAIWPFAIWKFHLPRPEGAQACSHG